MPWVLGRIPAGFRAIVVDNGSTDATATIAADLGAIVVSAPLRGFGSACWAGLQAATDDIVCFMDCDASLDPAALPFIAGYVERLSRRLADAFRGSGGKVDFRVLSASGSEGHWLAESEAGVKIAGPELDRALKPRQPTAARKR